MESHKKRILNELRAAGMTLYGTMKMETERLPAIVHDNEHIGGVVYGRTTGDKVGSAMLVATDKRIIFLDVKPLFVTFDEVSYDVVAGVRDTKAGPFAGVVLHTRVRDYGLRYVNKKCAATFVTFIEAHIELHINETKKPVSNEVWKSTKREKRINPDQNAYGLIAAHNEAVLSTIDREGNVHGTVIHYVYDNEQFYFVTHERDDKMLQLALHGQVALTIHASRSLQMVQISCLADTETDKTVVGRVFKKISEPKEYIEGNHFPPVISMKKGNFVVVRLTPLSIKYHDFSKTSW